LLVGSYGVLVELGCLGCLAIRSLQLRLLLRSYGRESCLSCKFEIKRWLNRVDDDALGLTFDEWDPTENVDSSQMPVAMMTNSSVLRAAVFTLREVFPPEFEAAARRRSTRSARIRQLEGIGPKRFILSVDDDSEFTSRCE